jgi:hypothetical protein
MGNSRELLGTVIRELDRVDIDDRAKEEIQHGHTIDSSLTLHHDIPSTDV